MHILGSQNVYGRAEGILFQLNSSLLELEKKRITDRSTDQLTNRTLNNASENVGFPMETIGDLNIFYNKPGT